MKHNSAMFKQRPAERSGESRFAHEVYGLFYVLVGLLLFISLLSYTPQDPAMNHVVRGSVSIENWAGLSGAYVSAFLADFFGFAAYTVLIALMTLGIRRSLRKEIWPWWRWSAFALLACCMAVAGEAWNMGLGDIRGGGLLGNALFTFSMRFFNPVGTTLIWVGVFLLVLQTLFGFSWLQLANRVHRYMKRALEEAQKRDRQVPAHSEAQPSGPPGAPASGKENPAMSTMLPPASTAAQQSTPASPSTSLHHTAVEFAFGRGSGSGDGNVPPAVPAHERTHELQAAAVPPSSFVQPLGQEPSSPEANPMNGEPRIGKFLQSFASKIFGNGRARQEPMVWDRPDLVRPLPHVLNTDSRPTATAPGFDDPSEVLPLKDVEINWGGHEPVQDAASAVFRGGDMGVTSSMHPRQSEVPASPPVFPDVPPERRVQAGHDAPDLFDEIGAMPVPRGSSADDLPKASTAGQAAPVDLAGHSGAARIRTQDFGKSAAVSLGDERDDPNQPPWLLDLESGRVGMDSVPAQRENAQPAQASHKDINLFAKDSDGPQTQPLAAPNRLVAQTAPASAPVAVPPSQPAPMRPETVSAMPAVAASQAPAFPASSSPGGAAKEPVQAPVPAQQAMPASNAAKPQHIRAALPPLELIEQLPNSGPSMTQAELAEKGKSLMTCLNDFSIQAELVRITPGPVVTSFEVRPAPGVKSSRIANLSDDLALSLKAVAVRIQAPIPGTDTVGIEVPNTHRELVSLRELLASPHFQEAESPLTMAIGKDIAGQVSCADLAKMPHMLVAGATGTGKSVFLNSVLMSFLYKARPEELKLLLVDPKRIEMAVYADLPHLVHPIVTDMSLAKNALDWAVSEMEQRYDSIARLGVRNVLAYNAKLKEMGDDKPFEIRDLEPMPYLVIIIDELADLMLTAGKDVETSIVRLAQLARAAGIHLIIATQRPSVDVVTGLIKANFPCRISFQVTSKHDSRTILDTVGAEHLLGKGDMLFKPAGGRFKRLHGAFVTDENVAVVADFWRAQQKPCYQVDFAEWGQDTSADEAAAAASGNGSGSSEEEQMYLDAVDFVRSQGKASISLIQRRFRIGFNKAARFIEQMEQDGIIGPADGSKPRVVR